MRTMQLGTLALGLLALTTQAAPALENTLALTCVNTTRQAVVDLKVYGDRRRLFGEGESTAVVTVNGVQSTVLVQSYYHKAYAINLFPRAGTSSDFYLTAQFPKRLGLVGNLRFNGQTHQVNCQEVLSNEAELDTIDENPMLTCSSLPAATAKVVAYIYGDQQLSGGASRGRAVLTINGSERRFPIHSYYHKRYTLNIFAHREEAGLEFSLRGENGGGTEILRLNDQTYPVVCH